MKTFVLVQCCHFILKAYYMKAVLIEVIVLTGLPVLSIAPTVSSTSDESITVTWDRFNQMRDNGVGPIAFYLIQYQKQGI